MKTELNDAREAPGAKEYQTIGKAVVSRLLTGRIASVLQCFMSLKLMNTFNPRVFDVHIKAAKNFEDRLAPQGPAGPLEQAAEGTYTDEEFRKWMLEREDAVNTQMIMISRLAAECCIHSLSREESMALLALAEDVYKGE